MWVPTYPSVFLYHKFPTGVSVLDLYLPSLPLQLFPGGGGEIEDYRSKTILAAPPIVDQTMLRAALSLAWLTS